MSWEPAIAEAYASVPKRVVILPTLELRHPSFIDEHGNVTPVRVVRDNGTVLDDTVNPPLAGWMLTLEPGAPVNGGETVMFQSCNFNFKLPGQDQNRLPDLDIMIDNVSHIISQYTDKAVEVRDSVGVTYREFLSTDTTHPSWLMSGLTLNRVKSTLTGVTGTASFKDLINKSFPAYLYRRFEFTGLSGSGWG